MKLNQFIGILVILFPPIMFLVERFLPKEERICFLCKIAIMLIFISIGLMFLEN